MSSTDCQVQGSRFLTQRSHNIIYCKSNESTICPTKAATKLCGEPGSQAATVSFDEAWDMAITAVQTTGPVLIQMVEGGTFGTPGKNYVWYSGVSFKGLGPSYCTLYGNFISPGLMAMRDPSYKVMLKSGCTCTRPDASGNCPGCLTAEASGFELSGTAQIGTGTGGTSSFSALEASTQNSQVTFMPGDGETLKLDGVIFNTPAGQTAFSTVKDSAGTASLEAANVKVNGQSDGQTPLYQVVNMGAGTFQEKFNSVAFAFPDGSTDVSGSTNAALSYTLMGASKTERNHTDRTITTDSATSVQKVVMEDAKVDSTLTDITNTTKTGMVEDTIVTDTASLKETSTNQSSKQLLPTTNSLNSKVVSGQAQVDSTKTGNTDIGQVSDGIMNKLEASGDTLVKETKSNNNFTNTGSGASTVGYIASENANLSVKATDNTVEAYKAEGCVDVSGGRNIVSYLYNDGGKVKFSSTGSTYLTDCGQNKNWTQKAGQLNENWANHTSSNSELIDVPSREMMLEGGQHSVSSTNAELDQKSTVAAYQLTAAQDAVSKTKATNSTLSNEGGPVMQYMTMDGATASASLMEPTLTSVPPAKAGYAALPDISGNSTICPAIKTMSMNDSSFTLNATGSIVDACQLADHQAEDNANMDITHIVAENNLENADISQAPFIGVNTGNGNTNASFGGTIYLNAPPTGVSGGANAIDLSKNKPTSKMESTDATAPPATKTINVSNLDLTVYPSTDVSGGTPVTGIAISMTDQPNLKIVQKDNTINILQPGSTGVEQLLTNVGYTESTQNNTFTVDGTPLSRAVDGASSGIKNGTSNTYIQPALTDMPAIKETYSGASSEINSTAGQTVVALSETAAHSIELMGLATVSKSDVGNFKTNSSTQGAATTLTMVIDQANFIRNENAGTLMAKKLTEDSMPPVAEKIQLQHEGSHTHNVGNRILQSDGQGFDQQLMDSSTQTSIATGQIAAGSATDASFYHTQIVGNSDPTVPGPTNLSLPVASIDKLVRMGGNCRDVTMTGENGSHTINDVARLSTVQDVSGTSTFHNINVSGSGNCRSFKIGSLLESDGNNQSILACENSSITTGNSNNFDVVGNVSQNIQAEGPSNVRTFTAGQVSFAGQLLNSMSKMDSSGNSPTIGVTYSAVNAVSTNPYQSMFNVDSGGNQRELYSLQQGSLTSMTPDGAPHTDVNTMNIVSKEGTVPAEVDKTGVTVQTRTMGAAVYYENTNATSNVNVQIKNENGMGYGLNNSALSQAILQATTLNGPVIQSSNGSSISMSGGSADAMMLAHDDGTLQGPLGVSQLTGTFSDAFSKGVNTILTAPSSALFGNNSTGGATIVEGNVVPTTL